MLHGVIYATAMVEAVLGRRVQLKIHKRIATLSSEHQNVVWIILYNLLNPFRPINPGEVEMESMPIILEEAERIYNMVVEKRPLNDDEIYRKMERIIKRKKKFVEKEIQNRKPNGEWI